MFVIKFKESKATPNQINDLLIKNGIDNAGVLSHEDLVDWVAEINAPNSQQAHLLPPDGSPMTVEILQLIFKSWAETYRYDTDLYYGRTPENIMNALALFVNEYSDLIKYVKGSELLIERGDFPKKLNKKLLELELSDEKPVELPKDEQTDDSLQSGLLLCKSWGIKPFWVVFANVESPRFMMKRVYKDDLYNNLYKTKEGYAVMQLPLLDLSKPLHVNEIFESLAELSLREHPAYFNTMIYNQTYMHTYELVESVADFYTIDELNERLNVVKDKITFLNYADINAEIVEKNGVKFVSGTETNYLYQNSKEKRVWDILSQAHNIKENK